MKYSKEKIKGIREMRGLSQLALANKAGISVATLNKIETSECAKPYPRTLSTIAAALDVTVEEFYINNVGIETELMFSDLVAKLAMIFRNNPNDLKVKKIQKILYEGE